MDCRDKRSAFKVREMNNRMHIPVRMLLNGYHGDDDDCFVLDLLIIDARMVCYTS